MSDESDRKAGRAELDRLNAGAKKPAAEPPKKRKRVQSGGWADVLGIGKAKERRVGAEGDTVSEAVDKAVNGAKLSY